MKEMRIRFKARGRTPKELWISSPDLWNGVTRRSAHYRLRAGDWLWSADIQLTSGYPGWRTARRLSPRSKRTPLPSARLQI